MLRWVVAACALLCVAACVAIPARAQTRALNRGLTVELGGGYAYTRFKNGGGYPSTNGLYGSLALNLTNWLQVYGDGDWQFGSIPQGNTRMYGEHIGVRFYKRPRNWRLNPFAEFLAGASRLDLNLTQLNQHFSDNGFSFRTGGGLDVKVSRHWLVRAVEADYYRTSFLNTHQNNLWLSAGVVYTFGNPKYPY